MLPDIISPWQTGFVPGRGITENILMAQEWVGELDKKLTNPNLILKLDMEKAYDRVSWSFLMATMRRFGFTEWVTDLVYRVVSNNWFSVMINGESSAFFKPREGG